MNREEVQEKIALTDKQKKAWAQLVRAVNKCEKEKVYFYQVLEHLGGLNDRNVSSVDSREFTDHDYDSGHNLQHLDYPSVRIGCGWADDTHIVMLK